MSAVILAPKDTCDPLAKMFRGAFEVRSAEGWAESMRVLLIDGTGIANGAGAADQVISLVLIGEANTNPLLTEALDLANKCGIPVWESQQLDKSAVGLWIATHAIAEIVAVRHFAAQARLAEAALRGEIDRLQKNFQELEAFVYELGTPKFSKILEIMPTMDQVVLYIGGREAGEMNGQRGSISIANSITQRLPISARALVAIELYCIEPTISIDAELCLSIDDLSEQTLCDAIAVPLREFAPGWNRITLPMAIDVPHRDAQLKLSLQSDGRPASITLALGPPVPISRFRIASENEAVAEAPIAVRAWRGLPGVGLPPLEGAIPASGTRRILRPNQAPRPRLLRTDDAEMGFVPVEYWEKEDAILVHPPAKGLTVGIIEHVPVTNLAAVSAVVHVGHAESAPLAFALGVMPAGFRGSGDPTAALGYWLTLPPNGWGEVHAPLEYPLTGHVDLVLAARVATGKDNKQAWALFRGFRLCSDAS